MRSNLSDWGCVGLLLGTAVAAGGLLYGLSPSAPPPPPAAAENAEGRARAPKKRKPKKALPRVPPEPKILHDWTPAGPALRERFNSVTWVPVFRDGFQRRGLGRNWRIVVGEWSVAGGRLRCTAPSDGDHLIVTRAADFSPPVRVTYRCRSTPGEAKEVTDLSFFTQLPRNDPANWRGNALMWRFGSFFNTLAGLDLHGSLLLRQNKGFRIKPGAWHTVELTHLPGAARLEIDGREVFCGSYSPPEARRERAAGGFYVWVGEAEFDDLVVARPAGDR
jgi:hypothetical protein